MIAIVENADVDLGIALRVYDRLHTQLLHGASIAAELAETDLLVERARERLARSGGRLTSHDVRVLRRLDARVRHARRRLDAPPPNRRTPIMWRIFVACWGPLILCCAWGASAFIVIPAAFALIATGLIRDSYLRRLATAALLPLGALLLFAVCTIGSVVGLWHC